MSRLSKATQCAKVRARLEKGFSITPLQAQRWWGIMRLAARIFDLKQEGLEIHTDNSEGFARYTLITKEKRAA